MVRKGDLKMADKKNAVKPEEKKEVVEETKEIKEKRFAKVAKSYKRKVSLKGVTSQYDNVEVGTFISILVSFDDIPELMKKCDGLAAKVFESSERDMKVNIQNVIEMTKDPSNSALVGLGPNLEAEALLKDHISDIDELLSADDVVGPHIEIEEDDIGLD